MAWNRSSFWASFPNRSSESTSKAWSQEDHRMNRGKQEGGSVGLCVHSYQ